ncbi:extracellular matrix protein 2 isoform X2 [Ambystoma mexicanum]|uniref:extracellular matrix protein 2 isoform X2 n=1 Tax=Ambystoma mexicanum TaxID=8296 RepID=UPI0037E8056F
MRISGWICVGLLIILHITFVENGSTPAPKSQRRKMKNKDMKTREKVSGNRKSGRKANNQPSPIPAPATRLPFIIADDNFVNVFDSLIGLGEQESSYNVLPEKKGHCSTNGMIMYDRAVWSPKPCITCLCSNGKAICDETICPALTCPRSVTRAGECCPVCVDVEPNDPSVAEIFPSPRTEAEMEELLRREEEERQEEEEAIRRKEAQEKKKQEKKREKQERERKELEARRMEEEELERTIEENRKRAEEEEQQRIEEEERKKREEEEQRKEEENKKREETKRKEKERQQGLEREEEDEDEETDEDDILRGDVFRNPPISTPDELPAVPAPLPLGCFISDITVSCTNAKLRSIPVVVDLNIKSFDLLGNSITSIPNAIFDGMPNLERINLGKNNLTSLGIAPHVFKTLKNLKRLYLDGNALVQIPPDLPPALEELKLNDNNIHIIGDDVLQEMTNLVTLELESNQLSEGGVDPLAFKPLQHLSYLRLGRNKFRTVPQGLPTSIEELYLEHNQIEEISETCFNRTNNLHTIVLRHNKLEESRIAPLAWIYNENLESIDLSYNKLVHVPSFLPKSLAHLVLMGNQIERIPGYVFGHMTPGLEYLYLSFNKLPSDGMDPVSFHGAYHSLRELFLDHNELISVPVGLEDMTALQVLRLNNNKIRTVSDHCICSADEDEDSKLEHVYLQNNYIRTRDISPYAFSCIRSYTSVVLKPQYVK